MNTNLSIVFSNSKLNKTFIFMVSFQSIDFILRDDENNKAYHTMIQ